VRLIFIICAIIALIENFVLMLTFRNMRKFLDDFAWWLIIVAFFLMLVNNLNIAYLVILRPRGRSAMVLITTFFIVKAIKNALWERGFHLQLNNFIRLEGLPDGVWKQSNKADDFSENIN
jgi:hypothetical protein